MTCHIISKLPILHNRKHKNMSSSYIMKIVVHFIVFIDMLLVPYKITYAVLSTTVSISKCLPTSFIGF